jgi:hypothetical protein
VTLARSTGPVVIAALLAASSAAGHGGHDASGYVSTVTAIRPAVPGLTAVVLDGDRLISVRNWSNRTVVVLDARRRPLFRFAPDGVFRRAAGGWLLLKRGTSYTWHDPRIHWGAAEPPAVVTRAPHEPHLIRNWRIGATVDGTPVAIEGSLGWAPTAPAAANETRAWLVPALVGVGVLAAAGVALAAIHRARRR